MLGIEMRDYYDDIEVPKKYRTGKTNKQTINQSINQELH